MASARDLLDQADALMRRNRGRAAVAIDTDIPLLTEAVPEAHADDTDFPILMDEVSPVEADLHGAPAAAEGKRRKRADVGNDAVGAEETLHDAAPSPASADNPLPETRPPLAPDDSWQSRGDALMDDDDLASASAADPGLDDELKWQALAEQISMQVLQRIDLFTDSGLKQQLAAHLQPIVDRAAAELVTTLNDHVGRLLRTYVAEAIEREIAQWRDENR